MNSLSAKKIGFWVGLIIFIVIYFLPSPSDLSNEGKLTAAIFLLMGIWWATEAMPLYATALLPLIFFPLLGIDPIGIVSKEYMNKVQFLFAGGFMIGIAMQKWDLHKRIALNILKFSGLQAKNIVAAFMLTSAILSMWVMNTSTAIMLLPIGISVIAVINETVKDIAPKESKNFQFALLLGIAYAASLGGISTPIGTSPNGYLIQYANDNFNQDIGFISWLAIGLPVTLVMVPLVWYILTSLIFPINFKASPETNDKLKSMLKELGQITTEQKRVAIIFSITAFCWVFRKLLDDLPGLYFLEDAVIAMIGGISLFFVSSSSKSDYLLNWDDLQQKFPWGLIFLFGGGMALAFEVNSTGLASWLANLIPSDINPILVTAMIILLVLLLTELTSNLTTNITFMPVIASVGLTN
jgi:sodium-dependent dicarboxylate transporter 2/3/5